LILWSAGILPAPEHRFDAINASAKSFSRRSDAQRQARCLRSDCMDFSELSDENQITLQYRNTGDLVYNQPTFQKSSTKN